jgi:hypothetical protein
VIENNFTESRKHVQLTLKQFVILEKLKDIYEDINVLIRKLIVFNNGIMSINNDYFNNFHEKSLSFLQKSQTQFNFNSTLRIGIMLAV